MSEAKRLLSHREWESPCSTYRRRIMSKPNFFSTGSPFLSHPLLTSERSAAEVDFVLDHTKLTSDEIILDVGCGFGRHSIELAQRGYRSVGIDPSKAMIKAAQERAVNAGVQTKFIQVKGEDFSSAGKFDAAICLFTTLGQINSETEKISSKKLPPAAKQYCKSSNSRRGTRP